MSEPLIPQDNTNRVRVAYQCWQRAVKVNDIDKENYYYEKLMKLIVGTPDENGPFNPRTIRKNLLNSRYGKDPV